MDSESRLPTLWQEFLEKNDDNSFYSYLQQFVRVYSQNVHNELELSTLPDGFLSEISNRLLRHSRHGLNKLIESQRKNCLLLIKSLSILAKNAHNIALIASLSVVNSIYQLLNVPLTIQGDDNLSQEAIMENIILLERLSDPYGVWKSRLHSTSSSALAGVHHEHPAAAVEGAVITFICECCDASNLGYEMKSRLVDLIGCILSGSQRNATYIICEPVLDRFCHILVDNDMAVLCMPSGLRRNIFNCFTLMVQTLHNASPEMRHIEVCDVVDRYLTAIEGLHKTSHSNPDLFVPLIDAVRGMIWQQKDLEGLKASFASSNIFRRLVDFVSKFQVSESTTSGLRKLLEALMQCLKSFLLHSQVSRNSFAQTVGYDGLLKVLQTLQPDRALLHLAIQMAVDKDVDTSTDSEEEEHIQNADVITMLINWIPHISHIPDQLWLSKAIYYIICNSERNRMVCCENNIILTVAKCVELTSLSARSSKATGVLMAMMEQLGALSITAAEIKSLVNLLQLEHTVFSSGAFKKRVLQAFTYMTRQQRPGRALCYFSLLSPKSLIKLPDDRNPNLLNSGFTFHTWLCAGNIEKTQQPVSRRIIYSFQSSTGGGFEAFISGDGHLQVALITENHSFHVHDVARVLADDKWRMVDFAHSVRGSNWRLAVYIDGKLVSRSAAVKLNLKGKLSYSIGGPIDNASPSLPLEQLAQNTGRKKIGKFLTGLLTRRPHLNSTDAERLMVVEAGHQHEQFGKAVGLQGEMGTVCIFKRPLEDSHIAQIYKQGANHMELFSDSDIKPDLVLFLHPKMCMKSKCVDMSRYNKDGTLIEGHTCLNLGITDMVKCIGGFQVMIPLLEQLPAEETKPADQDLFDKDSKENCLSRFLEFLASFIDNAEENADHLLSANSIPIIGALLQKVDGSFIDEFTLMSVQNLLCGSLRKQSDLYNFLIQHILLDFRIWNLSNKWEVRVAHAQDVNNVITVKDAHSGHDFYRSKFGVQFMLDTIRQFYCSRTSNMEHDIRTVRAALFDVIKFYVRRNIEKDELQAILQFIHSVQDHTVILETINMIQHLLDAPLNHQLHLKLCEEDGALLLYHLLANPEPYMESRRKRVPLLTKQAVLKVLFSLLATTKIPEKPKKMLRLEELGMGGLVTQLQPLNPPNDTLTPTLMDIVCGQGWEPNYTNLLSILSLSHRATPVTKLTISSKLLDLLKEKPNSLTEIVKLKGWQEAICCLLRKRLKDEKDSRLELSSSFEDSGAYVLISDGGEETEEVMLTSLSPQTSFSVSSLDAVSDSCPSPQEESARLTDQVMDDMDNQHTCGVFCTDCKNIQELQSIMLDIHSRLMLKGLDGSSEATWKGRLKVFHSLKSARGQHYIETIGYSRLLIEYMLTESCAVVRDYAPADAVGTQNGQQLIKLVYDFIHTHESSESCFSKQLLELTIDLLEKMTVWHPSTGWPELAKVGLDILLKFASHGTSELSSTASSKLNHLMRNDEVKLEDEIHYTIHVLHTALLRPDSKDNHPYILPIIRAILERYTDLLDIEELMRQMNLVERGGSVRIGEDTSIFSTVEWTNYIDNVVSERQSHCVRKLKQLDQELLNLWNEVEDEYNTDWHMYMRETGESKLRFKASIGSVLNQKLEQELKRYSSRNSSRAQNLKQLLEQWKSRMRFFTSKRGTWVGSVNDEAVHWMMSSHENSSRMRIKLIPNDQFDDHREASRLRDTNEPEDNQSMESVRLDAPFQGNGAEEDEISLFDANPNTPGNSAADEISSKETLLFKIDCDLISMMDPIPGRLEITNKNIYFFEVTMTTDKIGRDYVWPLHMLINIHYRLRNLQKTALEIFLLDGTNHFLHFSNRENRRKVLEEIVKLKRSDSRFKVFGAASGQASQVLKRAELTSKWVKREISNFDYLMQLNTIAGRTYNDWSQYPVFPWVLSNYISSELDLNNPENYRDFTKPAGALLPSIEAELQTRFQEFNDPGGMWPFHHGTHYSSAAGVVTHYLVRMEPFTSKHIELQNCRFDITDRLFFSVHGSFSSVLNSVNDCKELTPDFFCLPEFLVNINGYDLGRRKGDVTLPEWAQSDNQSDDSMTEKIQRADDFIWKHRKALESDHVSENLHHWIDLIFGYKQRGEEAVKACNVYLAVTYDGAYDLSKMTEKQRIVTEKLINEFGQTPIQLLPKEAHPQRQSQEECLQQQIKDGKASSILPYLKTLKCYSVTIHEKPEPGTVIFASIPPSQPKPFTAAGFDNLVTISEHGFIGMHQWQPVDGAIINKFVLDRDLQSDSGSRRLVGPFQPGRKLEQKLLAVSTDAERVYVGGYWDNSLRVYPLTGTKADSRMKHIRAHYGVVTCLHLDATGEYLVTGSADTTCKIWATASLLNDDCKPLQCLYGHDDEVTCVAITTEYDMVVSAAKDGTINIHTVRKGLFMQSIAIDKELTNSQLIVKELALSSLANIILYTEETSLSSPQQVVRCLLRYSINGHFLDRMQVGTEESPSEITTQLLTVQDYLLYGTSQGNLYIRELHRFTKVNRMGLRKPIRCITVAYTIMSKKHSHILVGLEGTPAIMIVFVRDSVPELKKNILTNII